MCLFEHFKLTNKETRSICRGWQRVAKFSKFDFTIIHGAQLGNERIRKLHYWVVSTRLYVKIIRESWRFMDKCFSGSAEHETMSAFRLTNKSGGVAHYSGRDDDYRACARVSTSDEQVKQQIDNGWNKYTMIVTYGPIISSPDFPHRLLPLAFPVTLHVSTPLHRRALPLKRQWWSGARARYVIAILPWRLTH